MKTFIRELDARVVRSIFAAGYVAALVLALFPPLYLWASGSHAVILGLPVPLLYWIVDAALVGFGLWAQYTVEGIRGELDEQRPAAPHRKA
ncbi:hypothetical protein [Tsukamurella soli]|uniref:Solute:sodium symporter small subunit n=1 Tax=Tsukamurella soli TaxID=644556 RepID=A0ABP8J613_9ACTN